MADPDCSDTPPLPLRARAREILSRNGEKILPRTGDGDLPNLAVKLGANGMVDVYNLAGSTDVVIDVVGWYS